MPRSMHLLLCRPVFFPCFAWSALVKRVLTIPFFADVPPVDESLLHAALKVDVERIRVAEEGLRRLSRARALAVAGFSSRFRRRVRHYLALSWPLASAGETGGWPPLIEKKFLNFFFIPIAKLDDRQTNKPKRDSEVIIGRWSAQFLSRLRSVFRLTGAEVRRVPAPTRVFGALRSSSFGNTVRFGTPVFRPRGV